jgi:hypothetical protein
VPSCSEIVMEANGNVVALGDPLARLSMPGILSNGNVCLIALYDRCLPRAETKDA